MRLLLPRLLLFILALAGAAPLPAAPGDLDPSFHGTGWFPLTPPGPSDMVSKATVIQKDGKILMAGYRPDSFNGAFLFRFLPDGSPDPAFNDSGYLNLPLQLRFYSFGTSIAEQADGKILIGAQASILNQTRAVLVRCLPGGSLDPAFGAGTGYAVNTYAQGETYYQIVFQSTGRILAAAYSGRIYAWRPDGTVDPGFAAGGLYEAPMSISPRPYAVQEDDKIVGGVFSLFRLLPDGVSDPSFNSPGFNATLSSILPRKDGTILAAGFSNDEQLDARFFIARFLPDGSLDSSFNGDGTNDVSFPTYRNSSVRTLLVQADGRILALGDGMTQIQHLALARFLPDGSLDTSFGAGGLVATNFDDSINALFAARLLPSGDALVLSQHQPYLTSGLLLARYQTGLIPGINISHPAGTPLLPVPPTPLDFGLLSVGSRTKEFTITNWATAPLTNITVSLAPEGHPADFSFTQPALTTLTTGQSTTFLVTFTPSQPALRTATLRIVSSDPLYNPFLISLTGRLTTALETWRITWFGSPDNSGPGADLNDFDHDGLPNLLEFATGTHPHQPSLPIGTLTKSGETLTFTWTHPLASLTDILCQVESSPAPAGPWSSTGIFTAVLSADAISQTLQATIPAPAEPGKQFVRLRVTRR